MGAKNSTFQSKIKNEEINVFKGLDKMMDDHLGKENTKIIEKRKGDFKSNLTIRVYSEEKITTKFKDYLETIKMEKWNIKYLDNGFSSEKTKELEDIYVTKFKNKKNEDFDEILIDSYESFIKNVSKIF